MFYIGKWVHF